jgi:hypothetical protein
MAQSDGHATVSRSVTLMRAAAADACVERISPSTLL